MARRPLKRAEPSGSEKRESVYIRSCSVFWDTPHNEQVWRKVLGFAKGTSNAEKHQGPGADSHTFVNLGTALWRSGEKTIANAYCAHAEQVRNDPLHWGLHIRQRPSSPPPPHIKDEDKRLGGKEGLGAFLTSAYGDDAPVGHYNVSFSVLQRAGWKCSLVPRDLKTVDPNIADFGRSAKLEEIGYRFADGVMGISEISVIYKHQPQRWDLQLMARGPVRIGAMLQLPFAQELVDFVCARIFSRDRPQP